MLLPTKHRPIDKSAVGLAAIVLRSFTGRPTVSELWERAARGGVSTFDQYVMALDLLFLLGIVEYRDGRLVPG